jgi:hypothetical protein
MKYILIILCLFFIWLSYQVGYDSGNAEKKVRSCNHNYTTYLKFDAIVEHNPYGELYLCKRCERCGKYTEELIDYNENQELYKQVGQLVKGKK